MRGLPAHGDLSLYSDRDSNMHAKAIVAWEPDQPLTLKWSLEEVQVSPPGDDEVMVQIHASGICHTDVVLSAVPEGTLGIKYPKVVGHEGKSSW